METEGERQSSHRPVLCDCVGLYLGATKIRGEKGGGRGTGGGGDNGGESGRDSRVVPVICCDYWPVCVGYVRGWGAVGCGTEIAVYIPMVWGQTYSLHNLL